MPQMRNYVVREYREVKVTANNLEDAIRIGNAAFIHGQDANNGVANDKAPEGVWGNTASRVRVIDIHATEE